MSLLFLIIGIILFVALVVLHEAGHALVARRNGVKVVEFGIGFPPKLWGKRLKSGMLFSVNALPIGGFVRLHGEHDAATGAHTYGGASLWAKTQILLAGVVVNWLIAALIFTILAVVGLPQVLANQITIPGDTTIVQQQVIASEVIKGSPADRAGVKPEDYIISLNGIAVQNADQLAALTKSHAGKVVNIVVGENGQQKTVQAKLNTSSIAGEGYAGIGMGEQVLRRSTWSAPLVGIGVTAQFTWATLQGLGQTITELAGRNFQAAGQNVAGPVGIFAILQRSSQLGFGAVLFLIGLISMTLAVMNLLPIPALDGGRLFMTLVAHAIRRPLTKEREETIQAIGFLALMALVVLITVVDVGRIIHG
jgi:regulator of sigma E protease